MQSMVLMLGLGGPSLGNNKESKFNARISEKEREGWEVIDMQISRPSFGSSPTIVLRLTKESN